MNSKQKLLTAAGMILLSAIITLHYRKLAVYHHSYYYVPPTADMLRYAQYQPHLESGYWNWNLLFASPSDLCIPLFALGVLYAGFFFLLASRKVK